jgi:hypothetical protein
MGVVATLSVAGVVIWWKENTGDENERKRAG